MLHQTQVPALSKALGLIHSPEKSSLGKSRIGERAPGKEDEDVIFEGGKAEKEGGVQHKTAERPLEVGQKAENAIEVKHEKQSARARNAADSPRRRYIERAKAENSQTLGKRRQFSDNMFESLLRSSKHHQPIFRGDGYFIGSWIQLTIIPFSPAQSSIAHNEKTKLKKILKYPSQHTILLRVW